MKENNSFQTINNSIRLDIQSVPADFDTQIHAVMRRQQSAKRVAYNSFADGLDENKIYKKLCEMFPKLTGWDVNAAIHSAEAVRASQFAGLAPHIEYLTDKIQKFEKIKKPKPEIIKKLETLKAELVEYQNHFQNGTVPAAIFGGKKLWKKVMRGVPGAKEQWRADRSDEYYSVGDSQNEYGNRHFRLTHVEKNFFALEVRVPDEKNRARWLLLSGVCSKQVKYLNRLIVIAKIGGKITVRMIRLTADHYQAFVSIEEPVGGNILWELNPKKDEIVCGIDLNLDHAAFAMTDKEGQFRGQAIFDYPNLGEMRKAKTKWLVGNLAKDIVTWAKSNKISTFILEDLKIPQKFNPNATVNRRTVTFSHRQLNEAIQRTGLRSGINIKLVSPAYTSWIGQVKYADMLGISRHLAAAYVIARRGLGFDENLPKPVVKLFPEIAESVAPKNQEQESKKNKQFREWNRRLTKWKENTPQAGRPWFLWATLYGIYAKSGTRGGVTNGRNYLPSLCRSGGHTPSVKCLSLVGQDGQITALTRIPDHGLDARPSDKADGRAYVAF